MKLAIIFHDNDFMNTFRGIMKTFLEYYRFEQEWNFTKEQIFDIINSTIYSHYLLYQNTRNDSIEELKHTKHYLETLLKIEDILINKEVDKYIKNTTWNSSETIILDTYIDYSENNPIYSI
jgi:hypothetical protein